MLKLAPGEIHNFKCGEIFCISSTTYRVACCVCGSKVLFDDFPQHFQGQHLAALATNKMILKIEHEANADEEILLETTQNKEESAESEIEDEQPIDFEELHVGEGNMIVYHDDKTTKDTDNEPLSQFENENDDINDDFWTYKNDSDHEKTDYLDTEDKERNTFKKKINIEKELIPFPCDLCDRGYDTIRSLRWHKRLKHDPNGPKKRKNAQKYKCDQCDAIFTKEQSLSTHKFKHTGIKCDICDKEFSQIGNMMRHKARHSGVRAHKCDECEMSFFTDIEKRAHMSRHTAPKPFICEMCGKSVRELRDHIRRHHTGERPAKCDVCGKSFYTKHDVKMHAVTHTTERPFSCDVCGSTFQLKKALRVHKKVHSNVRNHVCKICHKAFTQSSGLHAHMRTHDTAQKSSSMEPSAGEVNICFMGDVQNGKMD